MNSSWQRRRCLLVLVMAPVLASLACVSQTASPPTISPDCEQDFNPTEADLDYVLSFPGRTFATGDWKRSFTVNPSRTTATWLSDGRSGVAYIDYLVYGCGYTPEDLAQSYSEDNFRSVIFADYSALQQVAKCESPDGLLTLYQFAGQFDGSDYSIDFWVLLRGDTRILNLTLALPTASKAQLDELAASLFPQLSSCPTG